MLKKIFSVVGVFFILMLAATFGFTNDQLTGEAGITSSALKSSGYIVRLDWFTSGVTQLKMTVKSQHGTLQLFIVNTQTRIDINGRIAGPKELNVGDIVTVISNANNVATKISVKKPTPANALKIAGKIDEIRTNASNYVFVIESLSNVGSYYELVVTPDSQLWRNGRAADPSEFQVGDVGTATFHLNDLKIISFISISRSTN
ncbi:MAG TPA: hypothetical protein VH815_13065 [Acidobacteriota bacterium]